jgi:hypothetical protein
VPWGLNDPIPDALERNPLTRVLVALESSRALTLPRTMPDLELVAGARMLRAQGYGFVVMHEAMYPRFKRENASAVLEALFGEGRRGEGVVVWKVGQSPKIDG